MGTGGGHCAPPLGGRENVVNFIIAILWLKTHFFFQNVLGKSVPTSADLHKVRSSDIIFSVPELMNYEVIHYQQNNRQIEHGIKSLSTYDNYMPATAITLRTK